MVVLVEELERDVACTCRFGLADAGGNSIAVGDGSRNVDLEFFRIGSLVNDLDGERIAGRLIVIRRREFQTSLNTYSKILTAKRTETKKVIRLTVF